VTIQIPKEVTEKSFALPPVGETNDDEHDTDKETRINLLLCCCSKQ
jgi:hypothetical protein